MMQQIWKSFPRLLEQRINQLLDEAMPTPAKAFQLYKTCQSENLWTESFEKFSTHLNAFCSAPRIERSKSRADQFLERPMDLSTYDQFHFTFRTAQVESASIRNIASWAHHLMRFNTEIQSDAISISTLEKTLLRLTQPTALDKDCNLEFSDFCETWKIIVEPTLDEPQKIKMQALLTDLQTLDNQSRNIEAQTLEKVQHGQSRIYLTQTEIDWTSSVRRTAFVYGKLPKYPLSKGPDKIAMLELQKIAILYNLVQLTDQVELLKHRESIRLTILDRCDFLLKDKSA